MKPSALVLLTLVVIWLGGARASEDGEADLGRVCISVEEPGSPTREQVFRSSVEPGAGRKVHVYADASRKCDVLIVPFRKDGKLANGWRPQLAEVPGEYEEVQMPIAPVEWKWATAAEPFDFYAVFLPAGSREGEELRKLVAAMQNPKHDERLLALQTNKLRELVSRIAAKKEKRVAATANDPEIGGVFRGSAFPWRQFAQTLELGDGQPGVLILPSEGRSSLGQATAPAP